MNNMSNTKFFLLLIGLSCASYLPRVLPMFYFTKREIPSWFSDWMKYIPVSLFAALSFKDVFLVNDTTISLWGNIKIIAMGIVMIVAYKSKSMALSVVIGLLSLFLLLKFF